MTSPQDLERLYKSFIEGDPDLQRALDLVDLHYGMKEKHVQGSDMGLQAAREEVNKVLRDLQRRT